MLNYEEYSTLYDGYRDVQGALAQDKAEFWELVQRVQSIKSLTNILEIGVESGGTSYFWNRLCGSAETPGKVIGIDLNPNVLVTFPTFFADTRFIKVDSHTQEAYDLVRVEFPDQIDFLYIDGDHDYAGVRQDYEVFSPLVRSGGIIGFHDIGGTGARDLWNEISPRYVRTEKFHINIGTGVLYVD